MVRLVVVEVRIHKPIPPVVMLAQILVVVEVVDHIIIQTIRVVKVVLELLLWHIKDHKEPLGVQLIQHPNPDLLFTNIRQLEILRLHHMQLMLLQIQIIVHLTEMYTLQKTVVTVEYLYLTVQEIIWSIHLSIVINKVPER